VITLKQRVSPAYIAAMWVINRYVGH
jgi:hypothetical protein